MATVINTTPQTNDASGFGIIAAVIIAIALFALFVVYGLPALRNTQTSTQQPAINAQINVPLPQNETGGGSTNSGGTSGNSGSYTP